MFSARSIFFGSEPFIAGPRILAYATYKYPDNQTRSYPSFLPTANIQDGANWYISDITNPYVNGEAYNYSGQGTIGTFAYQALVPAPPGQDPTSIRKIGISQDGGTSYTLIDRPPGTPVTNAEGTGYGNGVLLYGGNQTYPYNLKRSTDLGVTWSDVYIDNVFTISQLYYVNGIWFLPIGNNCYKSTDDAVTFTALSAPTGQPNPWFTGNAVTYHAGKWVIAGNNNDYVNSAYSTDGTNWTGVAIISNATYINSIASGNGKFVAVTNIGTVAYSSDAITWTTVGTVTNSSPGDYYLAFDGTNFILIGPGSGSGTGSFFNVAYSSDAINWTVVASNALTFSGVQVIITNA